MKKLIIFILLFLVACQEQPIEKDESYTVINEHKGGIVHEVMKELDGYQKPFRVKGTCGSSCTYVFKFKDTCVYDNAKILFHAPRKKGGEISDVWFKVMSNWYPNDLKQWFNTVAYDGKDYWFSGKEMQNKFNVPLCN